MLGLLSCSIPPFPKSVTRTFLSSNPTPTHHHPTFIKPRIHFVTLKASNGDDPITTDPDKNEAAEDRRPLFDIKWLDLLNPDAENVLAVGLTGLLTWASVQVLWQLLFISFAILVAAVKYSFIAAILLFILITLL